MILVDTNAWVNHLRRNDPRLVQFLLQQRVHTCDIVVGELLLGAGIPRTLAADLLALPRLPSPGAQETRTFIERHRRVLTGAGIGWADAQIVLAAAKAGARVHTSDPGVEGCARRSRSRWHDHRPAPPKSRHAVAAAARPVPSVTAAAVRRLGEAVRARNLPPRQRRRGTLDRRVMDIDPEGAGPSLGRVAKGWGLFLLASFVVLLAFTSKRIAASEGLVVGVYGLTLLPALAWIARGSVALAREQGWRSSAGLALAAFQIVSALLLGLVWVAFLSFISSSYK